MRISDWSSDVCSSDLNVPSRRVGGMAELSGFNRALPTRREGTLRHSLNDLFPGAADNEAPSNFWSGLRPMTPDSTPIVGATPISNLFLNAGHGTLGWTMACGSGSLIAKVGRANV